jgi:hypothetical protein
LIAMVPENPGWFTVHALRLKLPMLGAALMVIEKVSAEVAPVASSTVILTAGKVPAVVGVPAKTTSPLLTVAVRPVGNPDCAGTV